MLVQSYKNGVATLGMTKDEARVLHDALTIAKLQVGPALLLGKTNLTDMHLEVLRGQLMGISDGPV